MRGSRLCVAPGSWTARSGSKRSRSSSSGFWSLGQQGGSGHLPPRSLAATAVRRSRGAARASPGGPRICSHSNSRCTSSARRAKHQFDARSPNCAARRRAALAQPEATSSCSRSSRAAPIAAAPSAAAARPKQCVRSAAARAGAASHPGGLRPAERRSRSSGAISPPQTTVPPSAARTRPRSTSWPPQGITRGTSNKSALPSNTSRSHRAKRPTSLLCPGASAPGCSFR
mmetsp:Transcript_23891/g.68983  ORF Transcript_23891/g.68983 Transcript_23891/m.68983 type:complete len:229 (-) Transcript_23891:1616-2302(-)